MYQSNFSSNDKGGVCQFCGYGRRPRNRCPERDAVCKNCNKRGHYARMCRGYQKQGQNQRKTSAAIPSTEDPGNLSMPYTYNYNPHLATMSYPASLQQSVVNVKVNNLFNANLLTDTGSSGSFTRKHFADNLGVQIIDCNEVIILASENQVSKAVGACYVNIELHALMITKWKM
jgi:hypothetical protein